MQDKPKKHLLRAIILAATLLAACATPHVTTPTQYDFGALRARLPGKITLPPLSVAEVNAPMWLDGTGMVYRLTYANDQQMRVFSQSRWAMSPARLFEQRLKAQISRSGGTVLSPSDGVANLPLIRVEVENFSQDFNSPAQSVAHLSVRVSVLRNRNLVAQRRFSRKSSALTADATGGAAAMAVSSDAVIDDILSWLATLPLS